VVTLTDFTATLELAAPEVTSSSVRAKSIKHDVARTTQSDDDRQAIAQARLLDQNPPSVPRIEPLDDR